MCFSITLLTRNGSGSPRCARDDTLLPVAATFIHGGSAVAGRGQLAMT